MLPGTKETLVIARIKPHGAYLVREAEPEEESVLLPRKELADDKQPGDSLDVFLYRDSDDRLIATLREPKITLNRLAVLKVKELTKIGAFLDWGLEKDLFLPHAEQTEKLAVGQQVLVRMYLDKSNRLCASQRMRGHLETKSPYEVNDWVNGRILHRHPKHGAFVAVEDRYEGLVPAHDLYRALEPGEVVRMRIRQILDDGRLVLSLQDKHHAVMDADAQIILDELEKAGGYLPLDDTTDPKVIHEVLSMSKSAFKRAVGRLLKQDEIKFAKGGIQKKKGRTHGNRR